MQALGMESALAKRGGFQVTNEHFEGPTACQEKFEKWPPRAEL